MGTPCRRREERAFLGSPVQGGWQGVKACLPCADSGALDASLRRQHMHWLRSRAVLLPQSFSVLDFVGSGASLIALSLIKAQLV